MDSKVTIKNISSATIRNELNALESMGYLKQLHTSGGRVPTSGEMEIHQKYNIPFISCMGTGNKLDPTRFEITDRRIRRSNRREIESISKPSYIYTKKYFPLTFEDIMNFMNK